LVVSYVNPPRRGPNRNLLVVRLDRLVGEGVAVVYILLRRRNQGVLAALGLCAQQLN
jgi:hypothetical protein